MKPDKVKVYRAQDGWRWHRISSNGRVLSDSGESYKERKRCLQMAIRCNSGPAEIYLDDVLQERVV